MPILNEDLSWGEIVRGNVDVQAAFRGEPEKVLLPSGKMLCRFITTETKSRPGNNIFSSPWWMEWTYAVRMLSQFKSAAASEVVRARLAITYSFSRELDSLAQILLNQSVYAWKGVARYQDDSNKQVTYIGGGTQLFVPNLAADTEGLSSRVAYLHCFTSVESLA